MAILFDWYENPKNKERQDEEMTLHPRIRLNGSTDTAALRRFIQEYCSLTETDVSAVLDAMSGRKVMLFSFTLVLFRLVSTFTGSVQVSVGRK